MTRPQRSPKGDRFSNVRLSKFLAQAGVCARRKADALISSGDVTVDRHPAMLGQTIDPARNVVAVRGRLVQPPHQTTTTLVLNKPAGVVTTLHDERGRRSVADLLPRAPRLYPVGRLDAATTGVLLCTNDGDLARVLTHPRFGVEKQYRVRAEGADGIVSFNVTLHEGKNRQIRRMYAQRGLRVVALTRVRFGPVKLDSLKVGQTRALTPAEARALAALRDRAKEGDRASHRMKRQPYEASRHPRRNHQRRQR